MKIMFVDFLAVILLTRLLLSEGNAENEVWKTNIAFPFVLALEYTKHMNSSECHSYTNGFKKACYHKENINQGGIMDGEGKNTTFVLSFFNATEFKVTRRYRSRSHDVQIYFHSKWLIASDKPYADIIKLITDNTIFNITLQTVVSSDSSSCSEDEIVELDSQICKWMNLYERHETEDMPSYDKNGRCVIRKKHQMKNYLRLWDPGNHTDFKTRCYDNGNKICSDFLANGKGVISKIYVGRDLVSVNSFNHFNIDMTINFQYWTEEFPDIFISTFANCRYHLNATHLVIHGFLKHEAVPMQFWVFLFVASFAGLVAFVALTLVLCTCSTKSFRMDIWEFWRKRQAEEKFKRENETDGVPKEAVMKMAMKEMQMVKMLTEERIPAESSEKQTERSSEVSA